jgi:hypothetical protein
VILAVFLANGVFGKDVYLSVGGEVGNFFTDARVLNPSFDKDIVITARYLQGNQNNSGVATKTLNVPKRTMLVLDNIVSTVFQKGGIGAIRLTSEDDFVATQRIYARIGTQTLGQFVPGLDATTALKKGVLIQLKQSSTFRTNVGGVNPNDVDANVTFKLYDKNSVLVKTKPFTFDRFGVLDPSGLAGFFESTNDLSDSFVSYESDQPIFFYGSIIDNASTDPTFIPASADTGTAPPPPPVKTVTITASNFKFTVTGATGLKAGDQVKFVLSVSQGSHGFQLVSPAGVKLIDLSQLPGTPTERTVTLPQGGTYFYFCTLTECGSGHTTMSDDLDVGEP